MFVDQNGIVTAEMKVINYFRRRDNFRCQVEEETTRLIAPAGGLSVYERR